MIKIEQLIAQHLYKSKQISLQSIGSFILHADVVLPTEEDKHPFIPRDAITFQYDNKAPEDSRFIDFIMQQTGKIRPLATSDLDSYIVLAKQFLNLGKPLLIEGLGTIQQTREGKFTFSAGEFIAPKIDDFPLQEKERKDETVSFRSERNIPSGGNALKITLIGLAVVLTAMVLYYFVVVNKPVIAPLPTPTTISKDSAESIKRAALQLIKDSLPAESSANSIKDGFTIILRNYPTQKAVQKSFDRLTSFGHQLKIITIDSTHYQLAIPFNLPLSDTLRIRDSIKKIFGGQPTVQF